jgi:DNA-binding IclR family transcriptional regulator
VSKTVARAILVLRHLAEAPRSLSEVAELLGLHKSTALRLLRTLEAEGFARRRDDSRYVVGFGVLPLAESAVEQIDVRATAHPHLKRLSEELGHTVHLAQLIDGQVVYVDKVGGPGTVAMGSRIGLPAEIHTAAVAKIIVSYLPEAERSRLLEGWEFRRYGSTTITDPADFLRELELTRERGWAEDDGEKEDYINCVALPVRDATGRVTLGMSVTALRAVAPLETLHGMVPRLREVADTISAELGWRGDAKTAHRHEKEPT